ncbi:hemerythrin domain-containing protein [Sphingomonas koreensis]|nr:hemerythrin domain-containing protein [Sphingomonas koreensis]
MTTVERDEQGRFISEDEAGSRSRLGLIATATAAGAALGMLAMIGRKTAVQAPTILAGDWPGALAVEHKAVLKIFDAIEATQTRAVAKRTMLLVQLKHALAKHAIEEENVIYPALRDAGERTAAEELIREHGDVKHFLYDLENMPKNAPDFLETLATFRREIESHMQDEETVQFPALFAKLSDEQNKKLTRSMNREGFKLA